MSTEQKETKPPTDRTGATAFDTATQGGEEHDLAPLLKDNIESSGQNGVQLQPDDGQIDTSANGEVGSSKIDADPEVLRLIQQYLKEHGMASIA